MPRHVSLCTLLLTVATLAIAQQPRAQVDPDSLAVIQQVVNAAGGQAALTATADYRATGTITYFWAGQEVTGPVTLRGRGATQFRLDAQLPDGTRSWFVNHRSGKLRQQDGTTTDLLEPNTAILAGYANPALWLLNSLNYGTCTLESNQPTAQQPNIRLQTTTTDPRNPDCPPNRHEIDATSFLIQKRTAVFGSRHGGNGGDTEELAYADYRTVQALQVPFAIEERIEGQLVSRIHLTAVQFNVGLQDTDFQF